MQEARVESRSSPVRANGENPFQLFAQLPVDSRSSARRKLVYSHARTSGGKASQHRRTLTLSIGEASAEEARWAFDYFLDFFPFSFAFYRRACPD